MVLMGSNYADMKNGDKAPEFTLPSTTGEEVSLSDFIGKPVLIIFMCNHCPYVVPKIDEIKRIANDFKDDLVVIGINPNEDVNYPDDSFENMVRMVDEWGINFLYLRDESQEVAKAYHAVCTPDPYLFDSNHKLIYHGRIDDTHKDAVVGEHELYNVISEFLEIGQISKEQQPSMGCSIKWK